MRCAPKDLNHSWPVRHACVTRANVSTPSTCCALRHASQILDQEANEIILLNSHDGSSSYQMIGGKFRFVCANGLVLGTLPLTRKCAIAAVVMW
nr:hypothetical protein pPsy0462b_00032 [Pseudomonas syringae]